MVFGVVRQSGGTVRIRSRLREGTTVQIYLPRAVETAAFGAGHARPTRAAEGAHILVVDDDPDVRWIIAQDLQEIGYVVTEADSGRAALEILERDTPCDLMVADLVMPELSGLDTLRLARRTRPDLKVLFASGYADLSRFGANLASHAFLKKPFKPETLAEAVQNALQRVTS
jgi:CheY-like chemotaxis protein